MILKKTEEGFTAIYETHCPECFLVVHVTEYGDVEMQVASAHEVPRPYTRSWWDRLRRAWDSLRGRYCEDDFVSLSAEEAYNLARELSLMLNGMKKEG